VIESSFIDADGIPGHLFILRFPQRRRQGISPCLGLVEENLRENSKLRLAILVERLCEAHIGRLNPSFAISVRSSYRQRKAF
jgi:hypothetical protein